MIPPPSSDFFVLRRPVARAGSPHIDCQVGAEPYLTVPDNGALAALVDYGCLSFHPWNSTAAAVLRPTQVVFNLDPEAIAFREVRNAALLLRDLLGIYGLKAWVKTSGGQGLHVLVPIASGASCDDVALVAETIVRRAIQREPLLFSRDQRPGRRHGRILLDTSRNQPGAALIAPYGVATSGLVSALLEWDELGRPVYPDDFDMSRVVARQYSSGKNQAAFFEAKQSLEPLLRGKRSRGALSYVEPFVHRHPQWLLNNKPAVVSDQTRWLRAQSERLRDEAQVKSIESANIRYRAQKALEELRHLLRGGYHRR